MMKPFLLSVLVLSITSSVGAYDFDQLNTGSSAPKKFSVEGASSVSHEAVNRHDKTYKQEAETRRQMAYEANQRAAQRSGDFEIYSGYPQYENKETKWSAACKEGGYAWVTVKSESPDVYAWGGGGYSGSKGGADIGIGAEASLRKACRGGH